MVHGLFQFRRFGLRKSALGYSQFLNQGRHDTLNPSAAIGEDLGIVSDGLLQHLKFLLKFVRPLIELINHLTCRQLLQGRIQCQLPQEFKYLSALCVTGWNADSEASLSHLNFFQKALLKICQKLAETRQDLDFVWEVINPVSVIDIEPGIVTVKNRKVSNVTRTIFAISPSGFAYFLCTFKLVADACFGRSGFRCRKHVWLYHVLDDRTAKLLQNATIAALSGPVVTINQRNTIY